VTAATKGNQDVFVVVLGATRKWKKKNNVDFYDAKNEKRIIVNGKEVSNSHRYQDSRTLFEWASGRS